MEVQSDFIDLLALFNSREVEYLIVGAYALAFHGVPRYTGDMDILVKPDAGRVRESFEGVLRSDSSTPLTWRYRPKGQPCM